GGGGFTCNRTVAAGGNIQNALSSAAAGSTVCMSSGTWSRQTFSGIAPSSTVTLRPAAGATVHFKGVTINGPGNTKNLLIEGFYIDGSVQGICGTTGGLTFAHNTIQNVSGDFGFYYYANGCGSGHTQTGISMLDNQIDHVGDCLTVAGGESMEANFTFNGNVCGPGIGLGAT